MKRRLLASILALTLCFSYTPAYAIEAPVETSEAAEETITEAVPEAVETPTEGSILEEAASPEEISESKEISENKENGDTQETEETTVNEETTESTPMESSVVDSGSCGDNLAWQLLEAAEEEYTLKITGSGAMEFEDQYDVPWSEYTGYITAVQLPSGLTSIAAFAFEYFYDLPEITLPSGITEIGEAAFYCCENLTSITIPSKVTEIYPDTFSHCRKLETVVLPNNLTDIDRCAFDECDALKSITLPSSLNYIGANAFSYSGLTSITIPSSGDAYIGQWAFAYSDLQNVTFSGQIESIDDYCFQGCSKLTSVTLPSSISYIGFNAFNGCNKLTTVNYSGTQKSWESIDIQNGNAALHKAFYQSRGLTPPTDTINWYGDDELYYTVTGNVIDGYKLIISGNGPMDDYDWNSPVWNDYRDDITSIEIQSGVTSIGVEAFYSMDNLTSVSIAVTVTEIGKEAFSRCDMLTSVTIPSSVKTIGDEAFAYCNALETVKLNSGLTSIGVRTFAYCSNLKKAVLPSKLTEIPDSMFESCYQLASVTIPSSVTSIGMSAFSYTDLASISIPDSVTSIGSCAFAGCDRLTSVTLPSKLTSIEREVFGNCSALTEITIPTSVTSISSNTFYGCSKLTGITIPKTVKTIGKYAFFNCDALETVNYAGTKENWEAISIASGNDSLRKAYYLFNNLSPSTETISGKCGDNATYTLTGEVVHGYDLSIKGTGSMYDYYQAGNDDDDGFVPWLNYKESIKSITIANGITHIGNAAFAGTYDKGNLVTSVAIPSSVTSIGREAFCNCRSLTSIVLPKSVTVIGESAFNGCSSLVNVQYSGTTANWNAIDMGDWNEYLIAAYNLTIGNLPSGQCGDNVTYQMTGDAANGVTLTIQGTGEMWAVFFDYEPEWNKYPIKQVVIKEGVTAVGPYSFNGMETLESVTLPDSLTEICEMAFYQCRNLTEITLPKGLETIGYKAFAMTGLTEITIPGSVTIFGEEAFYNCPLTDIIIEEGVKSIGESALSHCGNLKNVYLPKSLKKIDNHAFSTYSYKIGDVYYAGSQAEWNAIEIGNGNVDLTDATLHCNYVADPDAFFISEQPQTVTAGVKAKISYHIAAVNAVSYQWQYSKNGGAKWINSSVTAGGNTDTINVTVSASNAANIYRCVVTGPNGQQLISETAGVDLLPGVVITLNPRSNAVAVGEYATFTVETENAASFQWQYSKDGAHWYKSGATGNTTDTLTVKGEQKSQGNRYRCVVTGIDGNAKKSLASAMIVMTVAPKTCTAAVGEMASYSLKAEGIETYQWQYSKDDGNTWYKSGAEGATTDTVTFKATATNRTMIYRCKLTTPDEATAFTKPVGFAEGLKITAQPENVSARVGETATFTVTASNVESYQWQYSKDGTKWSNSGLATAKTNSITVTVADANIGNVYRCKLVGTDGSIQYTSVVGVK